jgi:glutathione S-transferase
MRWTSMTRHGRRIAPIFGKAARSACRDARSAREQQLPATRAAFAPLRAHLANCPFLGGASPSYADYLVLAVRQWVASVSTLPLLAADDETLRAWFTRSLDLCGGVGDDARMRPVFE